MRRAREEASAAIGELRDLARGIAPPVLADRGLKAALEALGERSLIPVTVDVHLTRRPPPVVETSAYFVAAEGITNVAKHGGGAGARVAVDGDADRVVVAISDDGPGGADPAGSGLTGLKHRVEALDGELEIDQRAGRDDDQGGAAVRVVIVEDNALLREGIVALLRERDVEVVAQAEDGDGLLRVIAGHKPDLAIVDVRLPPNFTDEGLRAAIEARRRHPGLAVLILSQYVEPVYTAELLAEGQGGVGYLLKERVGDVRAFVDALERVAGGGTALDREVVGAARRHAPRRRGRRCAGDADAARARGARAHGRGPHERGDRPQDGRPPGRGGEAHLEHLQQARPARQQRRPPPRAGGPDVPPGRGLAPARTVACPSGRDGARGAACCP